MDDVDMVSDAENVGSHLGIPVARPVAKVYAGGQHIPDA